MLMPTAEQLQRYMEIAEAALDKPEWSAWCREQLESAWRLADATNKLRRDITKGLFG